MDNEENKLYFDTEEERDAYNAAEAAYRGCDMKFTEFWYHHGQDENGFYIIVDDWS
jgi:hypothetical protein